MKPRWRDVIIKIMESGIPSPCPECGETGIQYKFVGDTETRVSYLAIWCGTFNQGIHVSRTRAPDYEEILPFDMAKSVIPNYKLIKKRIF